MRGFSRCGLFLRCVAVRFGARLLPRTVRLFRRQKNASRRTLGFSTTIKNSPNLFTVRFGNIKASLKTHHFRTSHKSKSRQGLRVMRIEYFAAVPCIFFCLFLAHRTVCIDFKNKNPHCTAPHRTILLIKTLQRTAPHRTAPHRRIPQIEKTAPRFGAALAVKKAFQKPDIIPKHQTFFSHRLVVETVRVEPRAQHGE